MPSIQCAQGPTDLLEISSADIRPMEEKQRQLESRMSHLTMGASRCRTEVNLTLQLLTAVHEAETCLSGVTMELSRSSRRLSAVAPTDQRQIGEILGDLDGQLNQIQSLASKHIPSLQQLASRFPGIFWNSRTIKNAVPRSFMKISW